MDKKALVVNLFGGPGVGKSTTAAGVFSLLKLHDVECEIITEFAKDLVWEERYRTFDDQHYLFGKQHHRMWRVNDKVDVMITDSPLMLSTVYRPEEYSTSFVSNVVDVVNGFDNLNIILKRTKAYNPNGRNETEDEAKEVDRTIRKNLGKYNMKWLDVPGNFEGINTIAKVVLDKVKIDNMLFSVKLTE